MWERKKIGKSYIYDEEGKGRAGVKGLLDIRRGELSRFTIFNAKGGIGHITREGACTKKGRNGY